MAHGELGICRSASEASQQQNSSLVCSLSDSNTTSHNLACLFMLVTRHETGPPPSVMAVPGNEQGEASFQLSEILCLVRRRA